MSSIHEDLEQVRLGEAPLSPVFYRSRYVDTSVMNTQVDLHGFQVWILFKWMSLSMPRQTWNEEEDSRYSMRSQLQQSQGSATTNEYKRLGGRFREYILARMDVSSDNQSLYIQSIALLDAYMLKTTFYALLRYVKQKKANLLYFDNYQKKKAFIKMSRFKERSREMKDFHTATKKYLDEYYSRFYLKTLSESVYTKILLRKKSDMNVQNFQVFTFQKYLVQFIRYLLLRLWKKIEIEKKMKLLVSHSSNDFILTEIEQEMLFSPVTGRIRVDSYLKLWKKFRVLKKSIMYKPKFLNKNGDGYAKNIQKKLVFLTFKKFIENHKIRNNITNFSRNENDFYNKRVYINRWKDRFGIGGYPLINTAYVKQARKYAVLKYTRNLNVTQMYMRYLFNQWKKKSNKVQILAYLQQVLFRKRFLSIVSKCFGYWMIMFKYHHKNTLARRKVVHISTHKSIYTALYAWKHVYHMNVYRRTNQREKLDSYITSLFGSKREAKRNETHQQLLKQYASDIYLQNICTLFVNKITSGIKRHLFGNSMRKWKKVHAENQIALVIQKIWRGYYIRFVKYRRRYLYVKEFFVPRITWIQEFQQFQAWKKIFYYLKMYYNSMNEARLLFLRDLKCKRVFASLKAKCSIARKYIANNRALDYLYLMNVKKIFLKRVKLLHVNSMKCVASYLYWQGKHKEAVFYNIRQRMYLRKAMKMGERKWVIKNLGNAFRRITYYCRIPKRYDRHFEYHANPKENQKNKRIAIKVEKIHGGAKLGVSFLHQNNNKANAFFQKYIYWTFLNRRKLSILSKKRNQKAHLFFVSSAVQKWCQKMMLRSVRRRLSANFYLNHYLWKVFMFMWRKSFINMKKTQNKCNTIAQNQYHHMRYKQVFDTLFFRYQMKICIKEKVNVSQKHFNRSLLSKYFSDMKYVTNKRLMEKHASFNISTEKLRRRINVMNEIHVKGIRNHYLHVTPVFRQSLLIGKKKKNMFYVEEKVDVPSNVWADDDPRRLEVNKTIVSRVHVLLNRSLLAFQIYGKLHAGQQRAIRGAYSENLFSNKRRAFHQLYKYQLYNHRFRTRMRSLLSNYLLIKMRRLVVYLRRFKRISQKLKKFNFVRRLRKEAKYFISQLGFLVKMKKSGEKTSLRLRIIKKQRVLVSLQRNTDQKQSKRKILTIGDRFHKRYLFTTKFLRPLLLVLKEKRKLKRCVRRFYLRHSITRWCDMTAIELQIFYKVKQRCLRLIRKTFEGWKEYIYEEMRAQYLTSHIQMKSNRKILLKNFGTWIDNIYSKNLATVFAEVSKKHILCRKRFVLRRWYQRTQLEEASVYKAAKNYIQILYVHLRWMKRQRYAENKIAVIFRENRFYSIALRVMIRKHRVLKRRNEVVENGIVCNKIKQCKRFLRRWYQRSCVFRDIHRKALLSMENERFQIGNYKDKTNNLVMTLASTFKSLKTLPPMAMEERAIVSDSVKSDIDIYRNTDANLNSNAIDEYSTNEFEGKVHRRGLKHVSFRQRMLLALNLRKDVYLMDLYIKRWRHNFHIYKYRKALRTKKFRFGMLRKYTKLLKQRELMFSNVLHKIYSKNLLQYIFTYGLVYYTKMSIVKNKILRNMSRRRSLRLWHGVVNKQQHVHKFLFKFSVKKYNRELSLAWKLWKGMSGICGKVERKFFYRAIFSRWMKLFVAINIYRNNLCQLVFSNWQLLVFSRLRSKNQVRKGRHAAYKLFNKLKQQRFTIIKKFFFRWLEAPVSEKRGGGKSGAGRTIYNDGGPLDQIFFERNMNMGQNRVTQFVNKTTLKKNLKEYNPLKSIQMQRRLQSGRMKEGNGDKRGELWQSNVVSLRNYVENSKVKFDKSISDPFVSDMENNFLRKGENRSSRKSTVLSLSKSFLESEYESGMSERRDAGSGISRNALTFRDQDAIPKYSSPYRTAKLESTIAKESNNDKDDSREEDEDDGKIRLSDLDFQETK
jgi:hypothetical protein